MWNFKIYMSLYKIYKIQIKKKVIWTFMRATRSDLPPSAHGKHMDPRAPIPDPTSLWLYAAHLMSGSFAAPGKGHPLEHILESGTRSTHHGSSCTGGGYWGVWRRWRKGQTLPWGPNHDAVTGHTKSKVHWDQKQPDLGVPEGRTGNRHLVCDTRSFTWSNCNKLRKNL